MESFSLLGLPTELVCHIMSFLDYRDIIRCTETCKSLASTVASSPSLQYTIELVISGLVPTGGVPHIPLAKRRRLLHERQRAWKHLRWRDQRALKLGATGSVYEFAGGLYANGRDNDRKIAESISFFQLAGEMKQWEHSMGELSIVDFTMDPSQDLLVLVAHAPRESNHLYEVHMRTISDNKPHPRTPPDGRFLSLNRMLVGDPSESSALRVQVAGDLVALLVKEVSESDIGAHLEIWNWKASSSVSSTCTVRQGVDDFCFLSHCSFLFAIPQGAFEVWSFELPTSESGSTRMSCATRYEFPALAPNNLYWYIAMSCNPSMGYVPSHSSALSPEPVCDPPPFYPRPDERIHACCLYVFDPTHAQDQIHSFVFFVNLRTLASSTSERVVPWNSWGPQYTRFFPGKLSTDWQHALYGYRTVECVPAGHGSGRRLRVRDYSPVTIARAMSWSGADSEPGSEGWRGRLVSAQSGVIALEAFAEAVQSSLPYVEIESEQTFNFTDVMMDDRRILLLERGELGEIAGIDVLTLWR